MSPLANAGHPSGTERRRARVLTTIATARREGIPLTVADIAQAAGVNRSFLYRHRDLLDTLRRAAGQWTSSGPDGLLMFQDGGRAGAPPVPGAEALTARPAERVRRFDEHRARSRDEGTCFAEDFEVVTDLVQLLTYVAHLERRALELARAVEDRQAELDAALVCVLCRRAPQ